MAGRAYEAQARPVAGRRADERRGRVAAAVVGDDDLMARKAFVEVRANFGQRLRQPVRLVVGGEDD
jgi:hypothetical protein